MQARAENEVHFNSLPSAANPYKKILQARAENEVHFNSLPSAANPYKKILQARAEHEARFNAMPSAANPYEKDLQVRPEGAKEHSPGQSAQHDTLGQQASPNEPYSYSCHTKNSLDEKKSLS